MLTASLVRTRLPDALTVTHWTRSRIAMIGSLPGPSRRGNVTVVPWSTASSQLAPSAGMPQNVGIGGCMVS